MIRYLTHEQIDKRLWDETLSRCYNRLLYGYSWYLDEVCDEWDALVQNDYEAVMPLPRRKKYGLSYVYHPFFAQQLGIFSTNFLSGFTVNKFLQAVPDKFRVVDTQLNAACDPEEYHYGQIRSRKNHVLNLSVAYHTLQSGYNENTKRNLNKARSEGVHTQQIHHISEAVNFYVQHNGHRSPEVTATDYQRFERVLHELQRRDALYMLQATHQKDIVAVGIFGIDAEQRATYLMGTSSAEGKNKGAMPLLMDQFIQEHSGKVHILDFEGSDIEGIARFYKGFGAIEQRYYHYYSNRLPFYLKWFKR